jgi:hypothetical protein
MNPIRGRARSLSGEGAISFWKEKSDGKRAMFLATAWLSVLVATPYRSARSRRRPSSNPRVYQPLNARFQRDHGNIPHGGPLHDVVLAAIADSSYWWRSPRVAMPA